MLHSVQVVFWGESARRKDDAREPLVALLSPEVYRIVCAAGSDTGFARTLTMQYATHHLFMRTRGDVLKFGHRPVVSVYAPDCSKTLLSS